MSYALEIMYFKRVLKKVKGELLKMSDQMANHLLNPESIIK